MDLSSLFQNYTQQFVSSQILKSPYEEIYDHIFTNSEKKYQNILILNQGVYIPLTKYFNPILTNEHHLTYIDENNISIHQLQNEIIKYKRVKSDSDTSETNAIDTQIETIHSNPFLLQKNRFKDLKYDTILIHHYNYYMDQKVELFKLLSSITHKGSKIILFASISTNANDILKNKIRSTIASYTSMKIGPLLSLEELLLSVPQKEFLVEHILPYRESQYIGYGKNTIYKLILVRN